MDEICELAWIDEMEVQTHSEIMHRWDDADIKVVTWQIVKQATMADKSLTVLKEALLNGKDVQDLRLLPAEIAPYKRHWNSLWVQDEVVLMGHRTVIPERLRDRILDCLHAAHQGVTQMNARADTSVFWPGISNDIERIRASCKVCIENAPSNPKLPPHEPPVLDYPFQKIVADYMSLNGIPYLVTVDRLTGWPDVRRSKHVDSGSGGLVKMLRDLFTTFGIPEEVTTDGGPEFTSGEVFKFLKKYGVKHRLSSVGNPHANQRAEVGVKSMKRLLRGNVNSTGSLNADEFAKAILQYRNTPMQSTGLSPAIALFGHPIRDFIPVTKANYSPSIQWEKKLQDREEKAVKASDREREKWSRGARQQDHLRVGHVVALQNLAGNYPLKWNRSGVVVEVLGNDQYSVKVDGTGRLTLRNRKHLKPIGYREPADPFPTRVVTGPVSASDQEVGRRVNETLNMAPQVMAHRATPSSDGFRTPVRPNAQRSVDSDRKFQTPPVTSTPVSRRMLDLDEPNNDSSLYLTPPRELLKNPVVVPSGSVQNVPKIHPELRAHNRPGLKEAPVDINAPRMTRSGKTLGI